MASLRAVFLDIGDTVMRPNPSWEHVYGLAFAEYGVSVEMADLAAALRRTYEKGGYGFDGRGEATEEASYRRLVELDRSAFAMIGLPELPDEFFRRLAELFMLTAHWHVFPDAQEAIEGLKERGLVVGAVSNWSWTLPELLHALDLVQHFDFVAASARVGYDKPHPGIFRHALQLADAPAEAVIHVGDNLYADVGGARSVGISPVLIDRHERYTDPPDDVPLIRSLAELLLIVDERRAAPVEMG